jgi:hypothetical protein
LKELQSKIHDSFVEIQKKKTSRNNLDLKNLTAENDKNESMFVPGGLYQTLKHKHRIKLAKQRLLDKQHAERI